MHKSPLSSLSGERRLAEGGKRIYREQIDELSVVFRRRDSQRGGGRGVVAGTQRAWMKKKKLEELQSEGRSGLHKKKKYLSGQRETGRCHKEIS